MVCERFDGRAARGHRGASCRTAPTRSPRAARPRRRASATGWRWCCRRRRRRRRRSSASGSCGAILLSMSVLYGDEGIRHRLGDAEPELLVTDADNAAALRRRGRARPTRGRSWRAPTDSSTSSTPRPTTRPSSTTRRARPGWRRASSTPIATSSRHEEFVYCHEVRGRRALPRHGRVGMGGGHRAAARPVAARRACSASTGARAASTRTSSSRSSSRHRGDERVHDADGDAGDDGHRRRRQQLPAATSAASARPASR